MAGLIALAPILLTLASCSDGSKQALLKTQISVLQRENSRLQGELASKSEQLASLQSEFLAFTSSQPTLMLARGRQLTTLGRLEEARETYAELQQRFPGSTEATQAARLQRELEAELAAAELQAVRDRYIASAKQVFQRKLRGSSGGTVTAMSFEGREIQITVAHTRCDYFDSVLLDFAIVCDRGEGWSLVKDDLALVRLTFACAGTEQEYSLSADAVRLYHTTTMSDFKLLERIKRI